MSSSEVQVFTYRASRLTKYDCAAINGLIELAARRLARSLLRADGLANQRSGKNVLAPGAHLAPAADLR
jgi:hypothetical protein